MYALDLDADILEEELQSPYDESQKFQDTPSHIKCLQSEGSILQLDEWDLGDGVDGTNGDDLDFQPESESESEDDEAQGGDKDETWRLSCIFSAAQLSEIHACLANTVIPTWIERPPTNLGKKSHGKLKADHWFLLFTVFLPLVIPKLWNSKTNRQYSDLLDNFYQLVTCTNILCSYSITPSSADAYLEHYSQYCKSSAKLFPNIHSRPNYHFAMHNADLMKFWGPLVKLSEFPGE